MDDDPQHGDHQQEGDHRHEGDHQHPVYSDEHDTALGDVLVLRVTGVKCGV